MTGSGPERNAVILDPRISGIEVAGIFRSVPERTRFADFTDGEVVSLYMALQELAEVTWDPDCDRLEGELDIEVDARGLRTPGLSRSRREPRR